MVTRERRIIAGKERCTVSIEGIAERFTPQQFRVFHLLQKTGTAKEIASALGVSVQAAKYHISNVYRKAGITRGRVEFWTRFGFDPEKKN